MSCLSSKEGFCEPFGRGEDFVARMKGGLFFSLIQFRKEVAFDQMMEFDAVGYGWLSRLGGS